MCSDMKHFTEQVAVLEPILKPQSSDNRHIYSVSELNRRGKQILETQLGRIWLRGEISNLTIAPSGHWYFTLKDDNAQIRCAFFRNKARLTKFRPKEGDEVIVKGLVSLYENRGDFQLIADYMEPAGLGELQRRLQLLMQKLADEGLFAAERKKAIPKMPKAIGVISSPTGAAIHDVLTVLKRRAPMIPVILYPALVQGEQAEGSLLSALRAAIARNEVDVLIITRGGGSLEDLWCFNSETLARALAECPIATIAAIGHEVDTTITELVADLRAATPSAAAELASPDSNSLCQLLDSQTMALTRAMQNRLAQARQHLDLAAARLQDPGQVLLQHRLRLDAIFQRMQHQLSGQFQSRRASLMALTSRLHRKNPQQQLKLQRQALAHTRHRLQQSINTKLNSSQQELKTLIRALNSVSPLATLERGYAIARDAETGRVLARKADFSSQQTFSLQLSDGEIKARRIAD